MSVISKDEIDLVVEALKNEKVVAFPTETVFGIACIASSKKAFDDLCEAKKRPADKPFTLMCDDIKKVSRFLDIDDGGKRLIKKFMPGQLTIIFKTKKEVPFHYDLGTGFIGVRIPNDDFVLRLLSKLDEPIMCTSANISGFPAANNHIEAYNYFKDNIEYIVEGESVSHTASTVIMIKDKKIILLREGNIKLKELEDIYYE